MHDNEYPNHLIPTNNLPLITIDGLNLVHTLGVWVDGSVNFKNSDGKLDPEAIQVKRIPGFSTNKIPESLLTDLNISFIGEKAKYFSFTRWYPGNDGEMPTDTDFERKNNRNHYFLSISHFHDYVDVYHNPPNKINVNLQFTIHVVHKPLIANYWHFEFAVFDNDNTLIEPSTVNATWKKLLCSIIRDRIQDKAIFELP